MTLKSIQKTLFILLISLFTTTIGYAAENNTPTIPKNLHGFWQFQVEIKGDWNGMHIGKDFVEINYILYAPENVTQTEQGYTIDLRKGKRLTTIQIQLLPRDSAIFSFNNNTLRCKRYTADPDIGLLTPVQYTQLFKGKWYDTTIFGQTLMVESEKIQYEGKTWRIHWLGEYLKKEYRGLIENNGEYRLIYLSRWDNDKQ